MSTSRLADEFVFSYLNDRHEPISPEVVASPPFLAPAMDRLRALSEPRGPGEVRSYFFDLASKGSFAFISPLSGHTVTSGDSVVLADRNVVFSCPQEPRLAIAAEFLGAGFPLAAFIDFQRNVVYSRGDRLWGFRADHLNALGAIRPTWTAQEARTPPIFVLGEQNYAHCALNQLPAVEALAQETVSQDGRFIATHEPLGPLSSLFPEQGITCERVPEYQLESLNQPGRLFIPCGANRVTRTVVQRVVDLARRRASPTARAIAQAVHPGAPCLWMSVRTINRTPSNQTDFLSMVGRGFLDRHRSGHIILDGLSLPADFATGIADPCIYSQGWFESVVTRDTAAAEEICERLGRPENVHVAVGLSILDSILLGGRATFYCCHHGSVQHKIGWFHPTPGVVHSNRTLLEYNPADWVTARSEVATKPIYLPPHFVTDVQQPSSGDDPRFAALELHSYTIDAEAAARYITNAST